MAVKRSFRDMLPASTPATEPEQAPTEVPAAQAAQAPVIEAPAPAPQPAPAAPVQPVKEEAAAEPEPTPAPVVQVEVSTPVQSQAPRVQVTQPAPVQAVASAPAPDASQDASGPARPHYTQLVRKELRVFQDQAVDLKVLTMTINGKRPGPGERITDNTLVRVAIDLLLQRKDDLAGTSEAELRDSLSLPPRY